MEKLIGWLMGERSADCLVLYGSVQAAVDLEGWYDFTLDWMTRIGCQPDRIGILGAGYPEENNMRPFRSGSRKLKKTGFGPVTSITLSAGADAGTTGSMIDNWTVECAISTSGGNAYLCCDRGIHALGTEEAVQWMLSLRRFYSGCYGFTYTCPFRLGPNLYPAGMLIGPENPANRREDERISKWAHFMVETWNSGQFPCDVLRDIYQLNFLHDQHLEIRVDQGSLRDWIFASSSHGRLSLLEDGWWLWSVDKHDIPQVFEELGRRRLIVCYGGYDTPSGGPCGHTYGRPSRAGTGTS
jgi:hypothetical protein